RVEALGPWIASLPEVERDMLRSNRPGLDWDDDHGDRLTEYVVIGTGIDEDAIVDRLDDALVTDEEWDECRGGGGVGGDGELLFPTEQGDEAALREP
ncbi:GTP-binding protein, partial [Halorubrum pallidum]